MKKKGFIFLKTFNLSNYFVIDEKKKKRFITFHTKNNHFYKTLNSSKIIK